MMWSIELPGSFSVWRLGTATAGRAESRAFVRRDIFRRYFEWHRDGSFDTGPVAEAVLSLAASGGVALDHMVRERFYQKGGLTAPSHAAEGENGVAFCHSILSLDRAFIGLNMGPEIAHLVPGPSPWNWPRSGGAFILSMTGLSCPHGPEP